MQVKSRTDLTSLYFNVRICALVMTLLGSIMLPAQAASSGLPVSLGEKNMSDTPKSKHEADQKAATTGKSQIASNIVQAASDDTTAKDAKPAQSFEAPYPFTAEELWEKILKVVDLPEGYVTREQVENIFGVKLKLNEEVLKKYHYKSYYVKRGENWYFNIGFREDSATESSFDFGWGKTLGQESMLSPPSGMCIDAYKIMPSIVHRGWELKKEIRNVRDILDRNDYRKGKLGVLNLVISPHDNCMSGIIIYSYKYADKFVH
jgi:hypothetical protein